MTSLQVVNGNKSAYLMVTSGVRAGLWCTERPHVGVEGMLLLPGFLPPRGCSSQGICMTSVSSGCLGSMEKELAREATPTLGAVSPTLTVVWADLRQPPSAPHGLRHRDSPGATVQAHSPESTSLAPRGSFQCPMAWVLPVSWFQTGAVSVSGPFTQPPTIFTQ